VWGCGGGGLEVAGVGLGLKGWETQKLKERSGLTAASINVDPHNLPPLPPPPTHTQIYCSHTRALNISPPPASADDIPKHTKKQHAHDDAANLNKVHYVCLLRWL